MNQLHENYKPDAIWAGFINEIFPDASNEMIEVIERDFIKKTMIKEDDEIAVSVLNIDTLEGRKFNSVEAYEKHKLEIRKAVFLINRMNDSSLFDDEFCALVRNEIANHKTKVMKEVWRFING